MKLQPSKCHLFQREVEFLGHIVGRSGVKPSPMNIAKILQFPAPTNVTGVRQVLGMGSYYRRFIRDYSALVKPLTDLTKKGRAFQWTHRVPDNSRHAQGQTHWC